MERGDQTIAELAARNLSREDMRELLKLQEIPANRTTASQVARLKALMEKLFGDCSDVEKATLTEYFSSAMLLGLDVLRHDLGGAEAQ